MHVIFPSICILKFFFVLKIYCHLNLSFFESALAINNQKSILGDPFLQPWDLTSLTEEMDD
jgi:hypothetical protein